MTVKPITPDELPAHRLTQFPESVIQCWNDIIAEKWEPSAKISRVTQDDIVNLIIAQHPSVSRVEVFNRHWLDVEDIYRAQGWKVTYDRPIYYAGEDFAAYFVFSKKS